MQSVVDAAKSATSGVISGATSLANTAASYTGLGVGGRGGHSHAEEHLKAGNLPPNSTASSIKKMDSDGLSVFEDDQVRHEVLVKINKLAHEDIKHERYLLLPPIKISYCKSIHVRVHKAGSGNAPLFHSIDTRPSEEGGAIFVTGGPLGWFDY
ncbi:uncharacterized protein L201_007465 [Kwoniella dendrophila CBS 6074]|uniref:Uncharacterized protein n=1 Tax=Kwoniella dendrophila CBS 6074 TaxID=1295534 RepID=A0AAX4K449_9TREE